MFCLSRGRNWFTKIDFFFSYSNVEKRKDKNESHMMHFSKDLKAMSPAKNKWKSNSERMFGCVARFARSMLDQRVKFSVKKFAIMSWNDNLII